MSMFGQTLLEKEFLLSPEYIHINHGSYGSVPKKVFQERIKLMEEFEGSPDHWFRRTLVPRFDNCLKVVADFLKGDPKDCVFVTNATTGCNSVLKSLPLNPGDGIMYNTYTYNAIKNAAKAAAKIRGGEVLELEIPLEIHSMDDLLNRYKNFIAQHKNIKVLILDYISSATALQYPVQAISELCQSHGIVLLLDGAHTPGQADVNLKQLEEWGVDYYTGNFHKWVFTPRGCAVLWINPKHHQTIEPAITSQNYMTGVIQHDFFTQGTTDHTAILSVEKAVEFYKELGGFESVHSYCSQLLDEACDMLVRQWGTGLYPVPPEMNSPFLRLVKLPPLTKRYPTKRRGCNIYQDMNELMDDLHSKYHITALCLFIYDVPWVRLSAFVYNSMSDYIRLKDIILELRD